MMSVAVLAGGQGQRLGCEKAHVLLGGRPLALHVAMRFFPWTDDLLLVLRPGQAALKGWPGRMVWDPKPYQGVLAGMLAALEGARHPWVFLVGCDMPWASPQLATYAYRVRGGYEAVVPRLPIGLEPLHALYHRGCAPVLRRALERGERRVSHVVEGLKVRYLEGQELAQYDPMGEAFVNINTMEDLTWAEALVSQRPFEG